MAEKDRGASCVDVKAISISVLVGTAIYLATCIIWAFLIHRGLLQFELSFVLSKVSLLLAALFGCAYAAWKGRGEAFLNSLSCAVLIFALGIMLAFCFPEKEWDTAGAVICLLICCMSCFFVTLQKTKNSKLHKRRNGKRKRYTVRNQNR